MLEGKKSRLRDRVYWKWKRHEGRDGRRRRRIDEDGGMIGRGGRRRTERRRIRGKDEPTEENSR